MSGESVKPKFDPNKPFEPVSDKSEKPKFNPSEPFESTDELKKKELTENNTSSTQSPSSSPGVFSSSPPAGSASLSVEPIVTTQAIEPTYQIKPVKASKILTSGVVNSFLSDDIYSHQANQDVFFKTLLDKGMDPGQVEYLRQVGQKALSMKPEIAKLREEVNKDHSNTEASQNLGRALADLGKYDEADQLFYNVLNHKPSSHEALNGLAYTSAQRGDIEGALSLYQKAFDNSVNNGANHPELYADTGALKNIALLKEGSGDQVGADMAKEKLNDISKKKNDLEYLSSLGKDADEIAKGKGVFGLFNPLGAIASSSQSGIETAISGAKQIDDSNIIYYKNITGSSLGDIAHAKVASTLNSIDGLAKIGLGMAQSLTSGGLAFGVGTDILPEDASKPFMQPVTTMREIMGFDKSDSDIVNSLVSLGNIAVAGKIIKSIHGAMESAPEEVKAAIEKSEKNEPITQEESKNTIDYMNTHVDWDSIKNATKTIVDDSSVLEKYDKAIPDKIKDLNKRLEIAKIMDERDGKQEAIQDKDPNTVIAEREEIKNLNDKIKILSKTEINKSKPEINEKTSEKAGQATDVLTQNEAAAPQSVEQAVSSSDVVKNESIPLEVTNPSDVNIKEPNSDQINDLTSKANDNLSTGDNVESQAITDNNLKSKSIESRIINSPEVSEEVKNKIKENGLMYEPKSQDEAHAIAKGIIDSGTIDDALALARDKNSSIRPDVRTMIYAESIDRMYESEKSATNEEEKSYFQQRQGELISELSDAARESGQSISALNKFYKISPLGLAAAELSTIKNSNDKFFSEKNAPKSQKGESLGPYIEKTRKKLIKAADESKSEAAENVFKEFSEKIRKNKNENIVSDKIKKIREKRDVLRNELREKLGNLNSGVDPETLSIIGKIGLTYIEEGYHRFKDWKDRMDKELNELGVKNITSEDIWGTDVNGKELSGHAKDAALTESAEKLAEKIVNRVSEKSTGEIDPIKMMINTLFSKVDEKLEGKYAEKIPVLEKIKEAVEKKGDYAKVWEESKSLVEEKISDDENLSPSEKQIKLDELNKYYNEIIGIPFSDRQSESAVKDQISDSGIDLKALLLGDPDKVSPVKEDIVKSITEKLGLDLKTASDIADNFRKSFDEIYKKKQESVLKQMFPEKKINPLKKKSLVAKITEAVNAGAIDDPGNFRRAFYDKYGLVDESDPAIVSKIKELTNEINKAPEGPLKIQAQVKLLNYKNELTKQSVFRRVTDLALANYYGNILSSYETHLRNAGYNIPMVFIGGPLMLAEKAILDGNFSDVSKFYSVLHDSFKKGFDEMSAGMEGKKSIYDQPSADMGLETIENRYFKAGTAIGRYSTRALQAFDNMTTVPLSEMKQYELALTEARKEGVGKSNEQIQAEVNELMAYTPERAMAAYEKTLSQFKAAFGEDFNPSIADKSMQKDFRRSINFQLESSRPEWLVDQGRDWARRKLFTNEPDGYAGVVYKAIQTMSIIPGFKYIVPFTKVPINMASTLIGKFPLVGYYFNLAGTRGEGLQHIDSVKDLYKELTPDEKREYLIRANNHAVAITALGGAVMLAYANKKEGEEPVFDISGPMTGDYATDLSERRANGRQPYTVYWKGDPIWHYKNDITAGMFLIPGIISDLHRYNKADFDSYSDVSIKTALHYIGFVNDQAAMKGLNDFMGFFNNKDQYSSPNAGDKLSKQIASWGRSMIVPNLAIAANNDIRGLFNVNDRRPIDALGYIVKDVPGLEYMNKEKLDHLGRPIKEVAEIPLIGFDLSNFKHGDKYYDLWRKNDYLKSLHYIKNRDKVAITTDAGDESYEVEMTSDMIYEANKIRGQLAQQAMDEKWDELQEAPKDKFKDEMSSIFSKAGKEAKFEVSEKYRTELLKKIKK